MAEAEVLCSKRDNPGLSVSGNRGPVKTGGGGCIERLRVCVVRSRVHVVLQSLSSRMWRSIVNDSAQAFV